MVLRVQDHVQGLLQALRFNFPSKMTDLDAYVSSYVTFRCFRRVWKVAHPFLVIWEPLFMILRPGRGSLLALEGVLCVGFAKLSSRDQVGCASSQLDHGLKV